MKNRIIKFRAYHKLGLEEDGMYEVLDISWHGEESEKDIVLYNPRDGEKNISCDTSCCKLMQFTGLLDKNGKESYAGDLVVEDDGRIYVIEWDESEACFVLAINHGLYGRHTRHFKDIKVMKIIGNIYENPELLDSEVREG